MRSVGCTRSSSIDRSSRRSPRCPRPTYASRPRPLGSGSRRSGYVDPAAALRHLEALTSGVSRRAAIQRTLLPAMLGWFADAPDPDGGLLGFHRLSDALGSSHWYLRMLRDEGACRRAARDPAGDQPLRHGPADAGPGRLVPARARRGPGGARRRRARHGGDPRGAATRRPRRGDHGRARGTPARALPAGRGRHLRARRRRDRLPHPLGDHRARPSQGALAAAESFVEGERRGPIPTRVAVIAMGRLGGEEMSYSSDADVLFVHDPLPGADEREATEAAFAVANEMRRLLTLPGRGPAAADRRRPAPRGAARPAGPDPGVVRHLLRPLVEGLGGAGPAARSSGRGGRGPRSTVRGAGRSVALPGGRAQRRGRHRGAPDQGAGRLRTAAARCRPGDPPQARVGRTRRHRVDRAAAPDAVCRRARGPADDPDPGCARARRWTPSW